MKTWKMKVEEDLTRVKDTLDLWSQQVAQLQTENDELRMKLAHEQRRIARLTSGLVKTASERNALASELRDTKEALATSNAGWQAEEKRADIYWKKRLEADVERDKLSDCFAESNKERDALAARLRDSEDYIHALREQDQQIERMKAELDDCNSRLGKITTQVGLSTRELQDAASEALTPGEPKRCSPTFLGFH